MATDTPERWNQVKGIFLEALAKPASQRMTFVEQASGGDQQLRDAVCSLLDHHNQADSEHFLQAAPLSADSATTTETIEQLEAAGHYRIERVLGEGAFGVVYLATDTNLERKVAIKVPHRELIDSPEDVERYLAEARTVAGLDHTNIVPVYHAGRIDDGRCFVVSKYIEGSNLQTRIEKDPPPLRQAVEMVTIIAEALRYAHKQGLVHRDIKPANILIDSQDVPYITDFGLAIHEEQQRLLVGELAGAPAYMSPEQCRREAHRLDGRTDIWALGVILYELLTGRQPFAGKSYDELFDEIEHRDPKPPRMIDETIPSELERICLKCLAKRISDRYTTAFDLARELSGFGEIVQIQEPVRVARSDLAIRDAPFRPVEPTDPLNRVYDENVQFTVYRPKIVQPARWYPMLAFAHLSELPEEADRDELDPGIKVVQQAEEQLGQSIKEYTRTIQDSGHAVLREQELTFVPQVRGVEFSPPRRSFLWLADVHREEFQLRASNQLEGRTARGRMSVFLGGILLAEVALSIQVRTKAFQPDVTESIHARRFRRLYGSYSRKDRNIVRQFEQYAAVLGDEFFSRCTNLRAGESWNDQVEQLINESDVFQLFWSSNSMYSSFVKREWEHALSLSRSSFIRPVYWEEPMPMDAEQDLPPPRLLGLGFQSVAVSSGSPSAKQDSAGLPGGAILRVTRGATPGTVHELHVERTFLGRDPNCHIVLDNGAVSRHHAQILENHGAYFVEDLHSHSGTYLNGRPLEGRTELHNGDQIRICDITLAFSFEPGPSVESSSLPRSTFAGSDPKEESREEFDSSSVLSKIDARRSEEVGSDALAEAKLKAILEVTRALDLELQIDAVLPKMLSALFDIFPQATQGFVLLKDPESGKLLVKATKLRKSKDADEVAVSMTVVREAMESGEALLSANVKDDSRFRRSTSLTETRIRSVMCAPLLGHGGEAFGAIQVVTRGEQRVFLKDDLELLVSVAAQVARAVENATLHEDVVRQRELERDLEFATQVQLGFLPQSRPRVDQYAFADYHDSGERFGGDYFDYIELADGRVAITIGDVAERGTPAALLMARLYSSTRFQLLTHTDLPSAVSGLNAEMASSGLGHRIITFLVMVIDPSAHRISLVNAGHLPPLIRRSDGTVTEVGRAESSLPLGILPELECQESRFFLAPGELVIAYTDGLTEAVNDHREIYGRKRLEACISGAPASIDEQVKAMISDVEDFVGESTSRNDTCIVGFQRLSPDTLSSK